MSSERDEAIAHDQALVTALRERADNGQLRWEDVRPLIAPILDDRFVIVERP
jgi:hypothetical protein